MYPEDEEVEEDSASEASGDEEMNRRHHHHHHPGKHHCIVECYFNKTGIFKDRQVVKTTALKLFSDNTDSSGTFQASLSSGIDTCIAESE